MDSTAYSSESLSSNKHLHSLPDGRELCYSMHGTPLSPSCPLIVYLHGFPSSRIESVLWSPEATQRHASIYSSKSASKSNSIPEYTLIAPERPGSGGSTPHPARSILSFADDVLSLLDALNVKEFRILAISGGCPYAFALRERTPATRLKKVTIVSGIYPYSLGMKGMLLPIRAIATIGAWAPTWMTTQLISLGIGAAAMNPDAEELSKIMIKRMEGSPEKDRKCFEDQDFMHVLLEATREAFSSGSMPQAVELKLLGDWKFEIDGQQGNNAETKEQDGTNHARVHVWHGVQDVNAPIGMADKAVKKLGNLCEYTRLEAESHVSLPFNYNQQILLDVLKD